VSYFRSPVLKMRVHLTLSSGSAARGFIMGVARTRCWSPLGNSGSRDEALVEVFDMARSAGGGEPPGDMF